MSANNLVSIIIPTYNRADLIGQTLDSVLVQTYQNWECIVVDDGSTDKTAEVVSCYLAKDNRFRYFERPINKIKGANSCRNYGLEKAKGNFINWFDSDDLMKNNFLERKLKIINEEKTDFVVSKSINFVGKKKYRIEKYKGNTQFELTGKNFILNRVYWMTLDFLVRKSCLLGNCFNESLQSGQETNFFMVFLNKNNIKGVAIDECLSLRRLHPSSIQQQLKGVKVSAYQGKLYSLLEAYKEIHANLDKETKRHLQGKIMTLFYKVKLQNVKFNTVFIFSWNLILNKSLIKVIAFIVSLILHSYLNKGYKIFLYARA